MKSVNFSLPLVGAACKFWKISDVVYTSYKIFEIVSKILYALQIDNSMEVFRKIFDALCKKSMHFLRNIFLSTQ